MEHDLTNVLAKARDFATEITNHNAREQSMNREQQISREHATNNEAVRELLSNLVYDPQAAFLSD